VVTSLNGVGLVIIYTVSRLERVDQKQREAITVLTFNHQNKALPSASL